MTLGVAGQVVGSRMAALAPGRTHGAGAAGSQGGYERVGIVTAVGDEDGKRQRAAYRHRLFGRWFREANETHSIRHAISESNGLYATLIYLDTNPFADELQY